MDIQLITNKKQLSKYSLVFPKILKSVFLGHNVDKINFLQSVFKFLMKLIESVAQLEIILLMFFSL